jgi:hypothetical protein
MIADSSFFAEMSVEATAVITEVAIIPDSVSSTLSSKSQLQPSRSARIL